MINIKFYKELNIRKKSLENRVIYLERIINNAPSGKLRHSKEHGIPRYYNVTDKEHTYGTYIKDKNLILQLCNKANATKALKLTKIELKEINSILTTKADNRIQNLYQNIQIGKYFYKSQNHMEQMRIEYINNWLAIPYKRKGFSKYDPEHYSMSGIRVRSKSEGKILDCLEQRKIPFKYECPITIDGVTYHPDVTCLNPVTMEIIYWEHWGSMDDPDYVNKQLNKLKEYRKAGLILGVNLFVTMETLSNPLCPETIYQFIDDHLS